MQLHDVLRAIIIELKRELTREDPISQAYRLRSEAVTGESDLIGINPH
jgi:hypothetical protein